MNASGAVVILAGVWVLCQVLGGNALERLNIVTSGGSSKSAPSAPLPGQPTPAPTPGQAVPGPPGATVPAPAPGPAPVPPGGH